MSALFLTPTKECPRTLRNELVGHPISIPKGYRWEHSFAQGQNSQPELHVCKGVKKLALPFQGVIYMP